MKKKLLDLGKPQNNYARGWMVIALVLMFSGGNAFGQVTIFSENMYNGSDGLSGDAIATHELNNRFNEDALTYSGTGDMRNTSISSVYIGFSGTWNVMLNSDTETFIIDGINASSYSVLSLSFGIRKSTKEENGSTLIIEYSTTGISGSYTSISIPALPTGDGTAIWHLRTSSSSIPSNVTTIRFKSTSTVEFRIDDVILTGSATPPCTAPTTQATAFTNPAKTQTTATVGWTRGNGNNVLVVAKSGSAVNANPSSGTTYTANAAFGLGTQIGAGNYVVYNGTGTSVNLTALTGASAYHFAVYEYNTTDTCYKTPGLIGTFTTNSPPSATIAAGTTLIENTTLNGGTVVITLANETFADATLVTGNFTLNNVPTGVTISGVVYNSTTQATITLAYDGTDFDTNVTNFNVSINNNELTTSVAPLVSNNITITAVAETLTATSTLAFGSVCNGSSSAEFTFTITGSNLKAGTISLAALSGYAYSLTTGGTFTSTLSFANAAGTLAAKTIYIKLTPTAANATYNGNIAISSVGAPTINKAVTGNSMVVAAAVATNTANSIAATSATLGATSSTFGICPATTEKGFVYAVNAINAAPVNGGTGVITSPNGTLSSAGSFTQAITGLAEGTTYAYQAYLFNGSTYTYGTVKTFQTTVTAPSGNVTAAKACLTDTAGTISWTAPTTAPTGYMVFAVAATTAGTGSPTTAVIDYATVNSNFSAATTYGSLGKLLYKGNTTSVNITGLTEDVAYSFRVFAYNEGAELRNFANGTVAGAKAENASAQDDVKTFAGTPTNNQVTLNWTYNLPTNCFDEVLIVANQGPVVFTPSGDGSLYSANSAYSTPNQVVYYGTATSKAITGLTNQLEYCFKIFVRRGTTWSDGTSICATPDVAYCASQGSPTDATGITRVQFNTIDQTSTGANAYTDFTAVSTTVSLNYVYNLSVNVNTLGFQNYTKVWIDWNHDGDFNDTGEIYDLGDAYTDTNKLTSNSPLAITVPINATIGSTRMRIATQYFYNNIDVILTPCNNYSYGEVEDYTITVIQPLNAEINVKGLNTSIVNGFDSPYSLNNTLFATTALGTDSVEKEFTIENIGIANLLLSGTPIIKIGGANPTDFIVTQQAATPVLNGINSTFKIKFNPTSAGIRTANVRIENNDSDENPYIFVIQGTGTCTTEPTITVCPTSGPKNTLVTFSSSTTSLIGATVTFNNVAVTTILNTTNKIQLVVPDNANDGNFIIQLANGCSKTQLFDVIDTDLTSCETSGGAGGTNASDLIIYEVYDETTGSGGVITLYNRTGGLVNLGSYSIKRAGDYNGTYLTTANLSGTIAAGAVAVIGVTDSPCGYASTGNGSFGSGFNANDGFRLMKGVVIIDDVKAPNYLGYYLKRKNINLNPNSTFTASEWTTQSLANGSCLTGVAAVPVLKTPPVIAVQPFSTVYSCGSNILSFSAIASEGVAAGLGLAYEWYFNVPGETTWNVVSGSNFSGVTTATLTTSNAAAYEGYQFYVRVKENSATCYIASKAVGFVDNLGTISYSSGSWTGGIPTDITKIVVIESAQTYNTINGPIIARRLINNGTVIVTAANSVIIDSNLVNNGIFEILDGGSLVQNCEVDNATANNNAGNIKIIRIAKPMFRYDFTYWSSPITASSAFTLNNLSPTTFFDKYYKWKHESTPQAWQKINYGSEVMEPGRGYSIRAPQGFAVEAVGATASIFTANFTGIPNNGVVKQVVTGALNTDKWNLLGNPYPSALDAATFIAGNTAVVNGTLYFWTHNSAPNNGGSGAYFSYNSADYASWNGTGSTATSEALATGDANKPTGKIAAGQSFFVKGKTNGEVIFNNSMRKVGSNDQFFKVNNAPVSDANITTKHRLWLNLKGVTKGFSQILIGYVDGATNSYDSLFDGETFGGNQVTFYSILQNKNFVIQGRALPFLAQDAVPLGYKTTVTENLTISIDETDGVMQQQDIYLEDNLLNITHNLKTAPYVFASTPGTFDNRFIVRYLPQADLANPTFNDQIAGVIIRKNNTELNVSSTFDRIESVKVFDLTGRLIIEQKQCNSHSFTATYLPCSNQVLIVKVQLKRGGIVTQKVL